MMLVRPPAPNHRRLFACLRQARPAVPSPSRYRSKGRSRAYSFALTAAATASAVMPNFS